MSWSASFKNPIEKASADAWIEGLTTGTGDPKHEDQLRTAKMAAKLIITNVPGPYIHVSVSGHANGTGWAKKEGWANDCISVSVTQMAEGDYGVPTTPKANM